MLPNAFGLSEGRICKIASSSELLAKKGEPCTSAMPSSLPPWKEHSRGGTTGYNINTPRQVGAEERAISLWGNMYTIYKWPVPLETDAWEK